MYNINVNNVKQSLRLHTIPNNMVPKIYGLTFTHTFVTRTLATSGIETQHEIRTTRTLARDPQVEVEEERASGSVLDRSLALAQRTDMPLARTPELATAAARPHAGLVPARRP